MCSQHGLFLADEHLLSGHEPGLDKIYVCYSEESRPL
jgi:hypothetical protein